MSSETAFKDVQHAAEKAFADMGASKVENTHGPRSLAMLVTWPDGSAAQLALSWLVPPNDHSRSGGDDGG